MAIFPIKDTIQTIELASIYELEKTRQTLNLLNSILIKWVEWLYEDKDNYLIT